MTAAAYRLVVRGELDDRFAYLFQGMKLESVCGTTVLSGDVVDQAMLYGLIERIEDLGLELLEIQQIADSRRGGQLGEAPVQE
jgi:hypothetical protein